MNKSMIWEIDYENFLKSIKPSFLNRDDHEDIDAIMTRIYPSLGLQNLIFFSYS